ncbi:MAG: DUF1476 domain-containing protein [Micavibrio sp.]|nr:DUF1476 domain-containing protein [Micavibrio sp.]
MINYILKTEQRADMSDSFKDREQAFENKFKHDEELRFKVQSKAVKLFGEWAALQQGLKDAAANDYASAVLDADFEEAGVQDVLRKVHADLSAAGKEFTQHQLENEFAIHMTAAKKAIMEG